MDVIDKYKKQLSDIVRALKDEIKSIRANRPTTSLVEDINIDYHGVQTPLKHASTISIVPPKEIRIQVWETGIVNSVTKAIESSDLGLSASADGNIVRVFLPELSQERRIELVRHMKRVVEDFRIKIRNARDESNKAVEKLFDSGDIGEDDKFKNKEMIQEETDVVNKEIDHILKAKRKEIES